MAIRLIVGLGNPGTQYRDTRHNAGFWFIDQLILKHQLIINQQLQYFGLVTKLNYLIENNTHTVFLIKPQTFMNLCGKSVGAIANFYKIISDEILIVHDELDFEIGVTRLKFGGGSGGHNGLKDINRVMGNNYWRLRLGIGQPLHRSQVISYVLTKPAIDEKIAILAAIDKGIGVIELLVNEQNNQALKILHSK